MRFRRGSGRPPTRWMTSHLHGNQQSRSQTLHENTLESHISVKVRGEWQSRCYLLVCCRAAKGLSIRSVLHDPTLCRRDFLQNFICVWNPTHVNWVWRSRSPRQSLLRYVPPSGGTDGCAAEPPPESCYLHMLNRVTECVLSN